MSQPATGRLVDGGRGTGDGLTALGNSIKGGMAFVPLHMSAHQIWPDPTCNQPPLLVTSAAIWAGTCFEGEH